MSRSGYSDDISNIELINWRGAVASALRGRRGQAFLRELLTALDGLPEKRLIAGDLEVGGEVCALGAIGRARGMDLARLDPDYHEQVAAAFRVAHAMACEIMWVNDEDGLGHAEEVVVRGETKRSWRKETPEERFTRVRAWIVSKLKNGESDGNEGSSR